jgi:hypothetical protein
MNALSRESTEKRAQRRQAERDANMAALCKPAAGVHRGVYAPVDAVVTATPKDKPVRSEAYRRAVASLACAICGINGYSQCAHGNTGKGMAMKTDDRFSFPLCGPRPGEIGCHARFDQQALMTKEERRAFEKFASTFTQRLVFALGLWPKNVPRPEGV